MQFSFVCLNYQGGSCSYSQQQGIANFIYSSPSSYAEKFKAQQEAALILLQSDSCLDGWYEDLFGICQAVNK